MHWAKVATPKSRRSRRVLDIAAETNAVMPQYRAKQNELIKFVGAA